MTTTQQGTSTDLQVSTGPTSPSRSSVRAAPRRPGLVTIFPWSAEQAPATWRVSKAEVVGRSTDCDIRLKDPAVSRRHAQLVPADGGLRITDLGSNHGTFADGCPVGADGVFARYGTVLRAGGTLLLVCEDVGAYSAPMRRVAASFLGLPRDVIGGPELCRVWQQAASVATLSHPVLILGETGSGKEAVARMIHAMRPTPGPFVALNLAAIPEGLFESELFGHVRGAFTGATMSRAGALREASEGVLFVDEVADLRSDLQVKLLRALDDMKVRPLGSDQDVQVNVRLVAATSRDLRNLCAEGAFRTDLYYRLSGIVIDVPPLRERRSDILGLASSFLQQECAPLQLSVRAAENLVLAPWQGNVRELRYAIARASVQALAAGSTEIVPEHLLGLDSLEPPTTSRLTREAVEAAIANAGGNASRAAKSLGVSRSTLYNALKHRDGNSKDARAK
jgi:transcriptional regulator of acetoin/glycerol metabolism